MTEYKFTDYFEKEVLRKRPYLKKEWCVYVLDNAIRSEPQEHNRYRFWAAIPELGGRYLRVITLEDKLTITYLKISERWRDQARMGEKAQFTR
ncbi:MAG: hypothetical protein A2W28_05785 [Gammaproteobacteria bacterium RBG_16_51_14]|nr:MAG: hypothetical protein A2W28_05785 [Gammaproteobacteria bacterium RBG_16_51_14]